MPLKKTTLAAIVSLISCSVSADWSGGIEAGARLGADNHPAVRAYIRNQDVPLSQMLYVDWFREKEGNSYTLGYDNQYTISQSFSLLSKVSLENSEYTDIAREFNGRIGAANTIHRSRHQRFTLQTGVGFNRIKYSDNTSDTGGYLFAGGRFNGRLTGLLRFNAGIEAQVEDTRTVSAGDAGISLRIGPDTSLQYPMP